MIVHLIVAMLAAGNALAEDARPPFDAGKYPKDVQRALADAGKECKFQDGGNVTFAPDTVQTVDLTGDGRLDYIIQFGDAKCAAGTRAVFCGSGGCLINILVTLPDGRVRKVFDNYVRSFSIRPDPAEKATAPRSIAFELHGAYCGGHGTPSCHKERTITARSFDFKLPN
ncbi:hypothetical protein ACFFWD_15555 [Bradyrhizobium erythrophlei]|uniref:hypothetical protein n=1 Tax=Bradyrhizobium erythrophlei TaxID=1437360 RepID=UPI0035E7944F